MSTTPSTPVGTELPARRIEQRRNLFGASYEEVDEQWVRGMTDAAAVARMSRPPCSTQKVGLPIVTAERRRSFGRRPGLHRGPGLRRDPRTGQRNKHGQWLTLLVRTDPYLYFGWSPGAGITWIDATGTPRLGRALKLRLVLRRIRAARARAAATNADCTARHEEHP